MKVLIHESDKDIRRLYEAIFSPFAADLTFSDSVADTRVQDTMNQYDLVLMNAEYPSLDGLDAARKMVQTKPERALVLVSSVPLGEKDLGDRRNRSRSTVFMKPFNIQQFRAWVEKTVKKDDEPAVRSSVQFLQPITVN